MNSKRIWIWAAVAATILSFPINSRSFLLYHTRSVGNVVITAAYIIAWFGCIVAVGKSQKLLCLTAFWGIGTLATATLFMLQTELVAPIVSRFTVPIMLWSIPMYGIECLLYYAKGQWFVWSMAAAGLGWVLLSLFFIGRNIWVKLQGRASA